MQTVESCVAHICLGLSVPGGQHDATACAAFGGVPIYRRYKAVFFRAGGLFAS